MAKIVTNLKPYDLSTLSWWQQIYGFLTELASLFWLNHLWNAIARLLSGEVFEERTPLLTLDPWELEEFLEDKYEWRPDKLGIAGKFKVKSHWVTNPKVVMSRLLNGTKGEEDCDGITMLVSNILLRAQKLYLPRAPSRVRQLSVNWKDGGHRITVFKIWEHIYIYDYKLKLLQGVAPEKAIECAITYVLDKYADGKPLVKYTTMLPNLSVVESNAKQPRSL